MAETGENRSLKDVQKRVNESRKRAVTTLAVTVTIVLALIIAAVILCQMNTGELLI